MDLVLPARAMKFVFSHCDRPLGRSATGGVITGEPGPYCAILAVLYSDY